MAHKEQYDFVSSVKEHYPSFFTRTKVLEVGSLNLNGSIRPLFDECNYTGIDLGKGRDVDIVAQGHTFNSPDETYDVCISCECFEHNPAWIETFNNMYRMCKTGGIIIITCATSGRGEHGTPRSSPEDSPITSRQGFTYYKNLKKEDFYNNFDLDNMFKHYYLTTKHTLHFQNDLYFFGIKWSW